MPPTSAPDIGWTFLAPNFLLAALMYILIGQDVLAAVLPAGSGNYVLRLFTRITAPVLAVTRFITPFAAPKAVIIAFAVLWLLLARYLLLFSMVGLPGAGGDPVEQSALPASSAVEVIQ